MTSCENKLLLHTCCVTCLSHTLRILKAYKVTVLFYNPNIEPFQEYMNRLNAVKLFCDENVQDLISLPYENDFWLSKMKGFEKYNENSIGCYRCYYLRLRKVSQFAVTNGYSYYSTTLLSSAYKNGLQLRKIGNDLAKKNNISFVIYEAGNLREEKS